MFLFFFLGWNQRVVAGERGGNDPLSRTGIISYGTVGCSRHKQTNLITVDGQFFFTFKVFFIR